MTTYNVTIVTLINGSSVDILVKAIGGMTIVTPLGNQFKVCFKAIHSDYSHTYYWVISKAIGGMTIVTHLGNQFKVC